MPRSISELKKFFFGKNVCVTGHTGFKGSWLTHILTEWGAHVTGIALKPHTSPSLFDSLELSSRVHNYFCDIRDLDSLQALIKKSKPDIVFHLAAQALVRESYERPLDTITTNVIGTAHVLEALRHIDSLRAAVIITTDKVYRNTGIGPYREDDPLGGGDLYSASKAAADLITQSYARSFFHDAQNGTSPTIAIARAGNVIGGGDWSKDRLLPDIVRSLFHQSGDLVLRYPSAIRPWQYILELLHCYLVLAHELSLCNPAAAGIWNFGPPADNCVSVGELAQRTYRLFTGSDLSLRGDEALHYSKHEELLLTLNSDKARAALGLESKLNLDVALQHTVDWYASFYARKKHPIELTNAHLEQFFATYDMQGV